MGAQGSRGETDAAWTGATPVLRAHPTDKRHGNQLVCSENTHPLTLRSAARLCAEAPEAAVRTPNRPPEGSGLGLHLPSGLRVRACARVRVVWGHHTVASLDGARARAACLPVLLLGC